MQQKYLNAYTEYVNSTFSTIDEICHKHGFCKSSFYRALKQENLELPKKHFFTTCDKDKIELAEKMYIQGKSIKTIALELRMSEKTISKYLNFKQIKIRGYHPQQKNLTHNTTFFETIDTEEKAYWLGFIFADGSVAVSPSCRLCIELNQVDVNHLEKFKKSIESNHLLKYRKNRNTVSVSICGKKIVEDLMKYGCIPNKTNLGFIDEDKIPHDLISHFLRGYLDGDGFIDSKRYRIVYTIKLLNIAESIQKLFSIFNIESKIVKEKHYYRLNIETKENYYNALSFLYENANIFLDRKYETYKQRIECYSPSK